jgi:hypothetical protein
MRKTTSQITKPALPPPSISTTLKHYNRHQKNLFKKTEPVQPTEETVDRLNTIGKTYPFCVYYKQQTNDPL